MISAETAQDHLSSSVCHACGHEKRIGRPFCQGCHNRLPAHMQNALRGKGAGFADAYEKAGRCILQRRQTAREVSAAKYTRVDYRRRNA